MILWKRMRAGTMALVAAAALASAVATAAVVEDLYSATVLVADDSAEATAAAFSEALGRVLVKLTGRPAVAAEAGVMARFGDPAALVQQYRR
ncbi:MAG: DUF2066 domain-containing protein, partial [Gammaproteobacteria bacterium]|nr:DUF2066 domain-containing protein [Gammaproteobacteria bacterium]